MSAATTPSAAETTQTSRGLAAVLGAVLLYCLIHAGFRLLASGNLGEDDPLETLHVQQLKLIYAAPQPPLYDWVLFAVQRVLGANVAGFLIIKYAALTATAGFLYVTACRVLKNRIWAILVVEGMALIYQIAWRYHEGFTHEVGAMVAVAATLWAFERLMSQARLGDYLLFGAIAGLGLMTEMTYWMFLATLVLAALLQPRMRAHLADRRLATAALLALLISSPYWLALADAPGPLAFDVRHSNAWAVNLGKGLLDAVRGPLFYLAPLIVIVPLMIPGTVRTALADMHAVLQRPSADAAPDMARLILTQALLAILLCVAGAILLGASGYAMHRVMPLYLPSVIWLMSAAQRGSSDPIPRRRLAQFAALIAVVALSARLANMFVLDPVCKICRWGVPYAGLAAELKARGFDGHGLIVAPGTELAGNLRAQFPTARVSASAAPQPFDWAHPKTEKVAIVWDSERETEGEVAKLVTPADGKAPDLTRAETVTVPWRHLWRPTGYRASRWRILVTEYHSPGKG